MATYQVPGKPILVLSFNDQSDDDRVHNTYLQSIELAQTFHSSVYRIVDLRQAPHNYRQIVAAIRDITTGLSGAGTTPDLAMAFVGQPTMGSTLRAMGLTFFDSMECGLNYAVGKLQHALLVV